MVLGTVTEEDNPDDDKWLQGLCINRATVQLRIYTGADITVMSEDTYLCLSQQPPLTATGSQVLVES